MKRHDCYLNQLLNEKFPNRIPIRVFKKCLNKLNKVFKKMNEEKIVHRDIKPENILIEYINNYNFNFILSDFNLGKYMNDNSKLSSICGSIWLPKLEPIILNIIEIDLYSLGITILKMLNKLDYNCNKIPDLNDKLLEDL